MTTTGTSGSGAWANSTPGGKWHLGKVNDAAQVEIREVETNEFRQILGQTDHLDVGHVMRHDATTQLDALAGRGIEEMQGHGHAQFLVRLNTLEVRMQDEGLGGVTLQGLEHHALGLSRDIKAQNVGIKGLVL